MILVGENFWFIPESYLDDFPGRYYDNFASSSKHSGCFGQTRIEPLCILDSIQMFILLIFLSRFVT